MNRKHFLSSALSFFTTVPLVSKKEEDLSSFYNSEKELRVPPYLKAGDLVGITSPAGFITREDIEPAVNKMHEWKYKIKIGNAIGRRDFSFGGTDEERLADMQQMLDDKNIKAIMCARGGYGTVRIIDQLNFKNFMLNPKWIIGFSDITVMHNHIHRHCNIATIHSKMCNSFPAEWLLAEQVQRDSIESIHQCLSGEKMFYHIEPDLNNKPGQASGQLIGGNLKTLESLAGTPSDINTNNKILFLEDTGEYLYSLDRMWWNLKRSGKLSGLKGLIIGGFKVKPDDEGEEFGRRLESIILEKVKEYDYPVCFNFPVGHQKNNLALKCGALHRLDVTASSVTLKEI